MTNSDPVSSLLEVDGEVLRPEQVYRKIGPVKVQAMMDAGALGYYLKAGGNTQVDMVTAVRMVAAGEFWFGKGLEAWMLYKLRDKKEEGELTQQQIDILRLVALGEINKEIALALKLEVRTVETYIHRICKQMGANNRAHAVAIAMEKGWLKLKTG